MAKKKTRRRDPQNKPSETAGDRQPANQRMPASEASQIVSSVGDPVRDRMQEIDKELEARLKDLEKQRRSKVYPLLLGENDLSNETVDDVFDDLRSKINTGNAHLDVIVHSIGGDVHAAYNLSLLFRRFAAERLTFMVPRWAKSAATLLVCAGNEILMGPISEIGPVDPQISTFIPFERRFEKFTPLSIGATLELIRREFEDGNEKLAQGLLQRLQFPLTLGEFRGPDKTHWIDRNALLFQHFRRFVVGFVRGS